MEKSVGVTPADFFIGFENRSALGNLGEQPYLAIHFFCFSIFSLRSPILMLILSLIFILNTNFGNL